MRVPVGKAIKVGPGDEIIVRGQLAQGSRLSRLYIFAKEGEQGTFSPYVKNISAIAIGENPNLLSPMSLRLVETHPTRELSFVSDIEGYIRVMQEVDTVAEPKAQVKFKLKLNPELGWKQKLSRKLNGIFAWNKLQSI